MVIWIWRTRGTNMIIIPSTAVVAIKMARTPPSALAIELSNRPPWNVLRVAVHHNRGTLRNLSNPLIHHTQTTPSPWV
jgi:hypothetical protein